MKFISLSSRGSKHQVVAGNAAWLRDYENGQTQVGKVEEIAASILAQANAAG